jgi:hypothetical protein
MDDGITRPAGNSFDPFWTCIADRPDPSRAEMAMHLYPHVLASAEACVLRGEASFTPDWREQTAAEAVKLADALRAALEKAKP